MKTQKTWSLLISFLMLAAPAAVRAQTYNSNNSTHVVTLSAWTSASGSIGIPNYVNIIQAGTFTHATLTSFTITNVPGLSASNPGLTNIGTGAFYGCSNLASISLPTNTIMISSEAFEYCTGLTTVSIAGAANIGGGAAAGAFEGCANLSSLALSAATNIGGFAFLQCSNLTSVTIPTNTVSIGASNQPAFDLCPRLTAINVTPGNLAYCSVGGVLFDVHTNVLVEFPEALTGSYTIPATVTNIGSEAFDWTVLTNINVPSSVNSIYNNAFADSTSLTRVRFSGNAPTNTGLYSASTFVTNFYASYNTGWSNTFGGRPALRWDTAIQFLGPAFPSKTTTVGFSILGPTNFTVVVQASTNLHNPTNWTTLTTLTLVNGSNYYSETGYTNQYPSGRFYRVQTQ